MSKGDKIAEFFNQLGQSSASIIKILLISKWYTKTPIAASSEEIVILGNGPSLNKTLEDSLNFLKSRQLLCVNFAGNTPIYTELKPKYYVVADPIFFNSDKHDNINQLWENISTKTDWNMTLFIPAKCLINKTLIEKIRSNANIKISQFNTTPIEGFNWFENITYSLGLGMPRPRNVLIPSLMLALRMNFKNIYITGADHSWTKTLSVTDDNRVVSIQPHFYEDDDKEKQRVHTEYMNYPLYKIMHSFYIAFKSYFTIERYAKHIDAKIWNISPESFIDAFPRKKI